MPRGGGSDGLTAVAVGTGAADVTAGVVTGLEYGTGVPTGADVDTGATVDAPVVPGVAVAEGA